MLPPDALAAALPGLPTRPHSNRSYGRILWYRHRHDLLGRERPIAAGRFNRRRGARILYLAEDYEVALHEVQQIGGTLMCARVLVPVCVELSAVLDLRDPAVQRRLGSGPDELTTNFRAFDGDSPTQRLGEACARHARIDGLLFPSAVDPLWTNLAVIEAALQPLGSRVCVHDPANELFDELP